MSADVFLDSNVLIYLFDETDVRKNRRAEDVVRQSLETGRGCISYQVSRRRSTSSPASSTPRGKTRASSWTVY